jgi:hypothetical protein
VAEAKTQRTKASVAAFIRTVADADRRKDCTTLARLMKKAAGAPPAMWGPSIIGFGTYQLQYASGRTGEWPVVAFSPRKQDLTLYVMGDRANAAPLLKRLGKHKVSGSCLHIKRLSDVDLTVLSTLVSRSAKATRKKHA